MELGFQDLANWLGSGFISPLDEKAFAEACQRRLVRALQLPHPLGQGDIAVLVRHLLRHEMEIQGGASPSLKVPRKTPFPTQREVWERSGIAVLNEGPDFFVVSAEPWHPEWLPQAEQVSPETPLFKEVRRRSHEPVSGDPFLKALGYETYQSVGQREAIRTILTAPPESTLVVNLPTGSGKSLCAHLPAWLASKPVGVTIVVVPTVALAIDQERAFKAQTKTNIATAYYSDTSIEGQERREEIRDRIRQGTQPIVFTSPEGLIESLSFSVYEAVRQGFLRYMVIDEAHIVEQWGDEFRPEFQELAGFRRSLLRVCRDNKLPGFPTLLLTATVTESCLDTLETLFGAPGPFEIVSSVQLRPEPSYWFAYCGSEAERQERLVEAVAHLPRPLIIYGSKVNDVDHWHRYLQQSGYERCAKMTGKSSQLERLDLLNRWQAGLIDIVVATSAFGLGVDLPDVRAVIHVCIPETIDRFYQEVGRGGRDGKATLSLVLHTAKDFQDAAAIGEITYITSDRGRQRWEEMFSHKRSLPDDRFQVPITVPPPYNIDLDGSSIRNQDWNIRTLTLMSRAGLIALDAEPLPHIEDKEDFKQAIEQYRGYRTVQISDEQHLKVDVWAEKVEPARNQRQQWAFNSLKLMKEALRPKRCLAEIFSEAYSIQTRLEPSRRGVPVERSCGGCPYCRQKEIAPFQGATPTPFRVWQQPSDRKGEALKAVLAGEDLLGIFYSLPLDRQSERDRKRLILWLLKEGIGNVVAPQAIYSLLNEALVFLFEAYQPFLMPKIPTLVYYDSETILPEDYQQFTKARVPHIVFLPESTPDPTGCIPVLQDSF
ncbi:ATP-dependent DNA helicase RecQ [Nodosilinea sp. LEGE 07298]|uniref:protein DpdF n=1 Tax=Nodosilinea sp. LEGE 07298 TaxID=2777970 RepID=UPI00187E8AFE|nr:protein DpdF [Nodosilinea sp. LEGE 07298]MBE9113790.1 ATP-dependent DNA helicase RecQ [Nodosilinea sp. LEGE 07298]